MKCVSKCPTGKYQESTNHSCVGCSVAMSDCTECSSKTVCTKCGTGKVLNKAGDGCLSACTDDTSPAFLNVAKK